MNRPHDQYIQVNGHRIRYWAQGESGPTVLLLHGISCSVLEWEHNIAALAQQHRVIAVDLLGSGLSDKPLDADYAMQAQARFVFSFMDAMGLSSVHLVGNSMGGCIALECAAMQPGRVLSMVLSAPAGIGRNTLFNFRLASLPVLGELLTKPSMFGLGMIWKLAFHNPAFVTHDMLAEKLVLARMPMRKRCSSKPCVVSWALVVFSRHLVKHSMRAYNASNAPAWSSGASKTSFCL
jgi:pimeloyl-ACP methyl ester carboxylesterase